jgi:hypothetical protein
MSVEDQLIDRIDLPVKCRIDRRLVPALGQNLSTIPMDYQCPKRELGNIRRQFDGPSHVVFVVVHAVHCILCITDRPVGTA